MSESGLESVVESPSGASWFASFEADGLSRLRVALVSTHGVEVGGEAAADAVSYAWEHRDRLAAMANPVGYLYRVGQSAGRRHLRRQRQPVLPVVSESFEDRVDPDLPVALARLSDRQRVAVVLVHVNAWTYEEAATAMGVDVSTVRTHVARALERLKEFLGEDDQR